MGPRVHAGRFTADIEGDFVVFLIGMRINKPWRVHEWWRIFVAMPLMLRELDAQPNPPLLGWRLLLASPLSPVVLQYWRSYDDLEAYANDPEQRHKPAWQRLLPRRRAERKRGHLARDVHGQRRRLRGHLREHAAHRPGRGGGDARPRVELAVA